MSSSRSSKKVFTLIIISLTTFFAYAPGIPGPFVFDDYSNILNNSFIRLKNLDFNSLYLSSFSVSAGPLHRPVAMLTFALNYYFGNNLNDATTFKLTNIGIHIISAFLLFVLCCQLYKRHTSINNGTVKSVNMPTFIFAGTVALVWALHPINLTSVLYVVQRMTSLSGLFSLASLTTYLYIRNHGIEYGFTKRIVIGGTGAILFALMALFSKENALLLPLFIILIEITLFADTAPWKRLSTLTSKQRRASLYIVSFIAVAFLLYSLNYASSGYAGRTFTLPERVMTETRVLCFYLSLIIIPRINAFGLYHDDIAISSSLSDPVTTIPSILFLAILIVGTILLRKKAPLVSLGIGWFFVGHLLESTIFGLEIAHEHRNYLPAIGIILAGFSAISYLPSFNIKKFIITSIAISLIVGLTTWLRANQWANYTRLAEFEVLHHPESAAAQTLLSNAMFKIGNYPRSAEAILKASELDPNEASYLMNLQLLNALRGTEIPQNTQQKILAILAKRPPSASTQIALENIVQCLGKGCEKMQKPAEEWLHEIIKQKTSLKSASQYNYLLGKTLKSKGEQLNALNAFQRSHEGDPDFLHPLFEMLDILIRLKQMKNAKIVFKWLEESNNHTPHPRDKEVAKLKKILDSLEKSSLK